MRILFLISGLMIGGAETQTIRLTRVLASRGHYVGLHVLSKHADRRSEIDSKKVFCQVDPRQGLFDLGLIRRIRQRFYDEQIDVVVSVLFDANIYARLSSLGTSVKVVNTERSSGYTLSTLQKIAHLVTRSRVDELISNSKAGRRHATEILGYPGVRCSTIWNRIEMTPSIAEHQSQDSSFESLQLPSFPKSHSNLRLLCIIGRLSPVKDHTLAIQTLEALRLMCSEGDNDWHLVIVGDAAPIHSEYLASLKQRVLSLNLNRFVHFTGASSCVDRILGCVDVLISTSLHEGFPNVILEAMQNRRPAISTDYANIREILPFDWQVVQEREPKLLAQGVISALQRRAEIVFIKTEVLRLKFSTEHMVNQYESALSRLLEDNISRTVSL